MRYLVIISVLVLVITSVCGADVIKPLALSNRDVGGGRLNAYTAGVDNSRGGLNNIGLLIKSFGIVTYKDDTNKFFYVNDGSGLKDGSIHYEGAVAVDNVGLRVSYDNLATGNYVNSPTVGSYIAVTGISTTVLVGTSVQPNLRPRNNDDVQTIHLP
ncbi:MAG: hypothetical protein ABFD54_01150 [Armatimonadota bacterium]|nr:hypothetical protein [bacterium]